MKDLDRWARDYGHNDFDTYIRAGGSVGEAMRDISRRIRRLVEALKQLQPEIAPEALRLAETDEPPDPENAQIQGAEHG